MKNVKAVIYLIALMIFLQGCSGEPFHLRGKGKVPTIKEMFYVEGVTPQSPLGESIRRAIRQSGSEIVQDSRNATMLLQIFNVAENKVAAGYSATRKVNEYDLELRMDYKFKSLGDVENYHPGSGNIDMTRTVSYDSTFALGKAEEEDTLWNEMRNNAARAIFIKLRYSRKLPKELTQETKKEATAATDAVKTAATDDLTATKK